MITKLAQSIALDRDLVNMIRTVLALSRLKALRRQSRFWPPHYIGLDACSEAEAGAETQQRVCLLSPLQLQNSRRYFAN